jgi:hypothetical protein
MGILFTRCFPRIASSLWGASIETPAILHKTCGVLPHLQLFQYARNVNECESWYTTVVQYTHYKESMKMGSNSSRSSMHWYFMICWALYILPEFDHIWPTWISTYLHIQNMRQEIVALRVLRIFAQLVSCATRASLGEMEDDPTDLQLIHAVKKRKCPVELWSNAYQCIADIDIAWYSMI